MYSVRTTTSIISVFIKVHSDLPPWVTEVPDTRMTLAEDVLYKVKK